MATQNRTLGRFDLVGIPPAPRGVPQIEVTFDIDANGIVHVSAKDLGTGKEQKIRIESYSGLTEDEIKRMVRDAESHAEDDRKEKEKAEVRNEADTLIYATEKSLKDFGDKITADERRSIEVAVEDLRRVIGGGQTTDIKEKTEALKQASYKLAEEVYKKTGPEAAGQGSGEPDNSGAYSSSTEDTSAGNANKHSSGKSNVEDVDYEVVDDDKE